MVKHMIIWTLKDDISEEEKLQAKKNIKAGLEGLAGKIPGMLEIHVYIDGLNSSNTDVMLDSTFEDEASLAGYAVHPAHVEVATNIVRPYSKIRSCFDYEC